MNLVRPACKCGKVFEKIPSYAKFVPNTGKFSGYHWQCVRCRAPVFFPVQQPMSPARPDGPDEAA